MNKSVTVQKNSELVISTDRPDFLGNSHRGAENVGTEDLSIPRIDIIQALSPQRKKTDPAFIPGAEEGLLFNSVTGELYGTSVKIIPVFFRKEYVIWKDRQQGGGFFGAYQDRAEAVMAAQNLGDSYDVSDTAQHFVLVVSADGSAEEAVISMSKSKMKASRQLNTLCRMAGGDSFSSVYELAAVSVAGEKGDYYNFTVKRLGYVTEDLYRRAESLYEAIKGGSRDVNRNYGEQTTTAAHDEY